MGSLIVRLPAPRPGFYIAEEMVDRGITRAGFAYFLDMSEENVERLLDGRLRIDEPLARMLGRLFEVSPDLFLNLQRAYDDQ